MGREFLLAFFLISLNIGFVFSQSGVPEEDSVDWEKKMIQEVPLKNPVYKPIVSAGLGIINFHGDIVNGYNTGMTYGNPAYTLEVIRAIDTKFKVGFRFISGRLSGEHRDIDPKKNLNFQTSLTSFGVAVNYNFLNYLPLKSDPKRSVSPFVNLGIEFVSIDPRADITNSEGVQYYYWSDGTIRNLPESEYNSPKSVVIERDYDYETSLRVKDIDEIGKTYPMVLSVPLDLGFDFAISDKLNLRLAYSYHLTFSDYIDDISTKGNKYDQYPEREGNKMSDRFSFAYMSLSLDLFSKTKEEKRLMFLELNNEETNFWDNDKDYVMDMFDQCPNTPLNQPVDTVGCPFDDDEDGVPDYADKEPNTNPNAFYVNAEGRGMSKDQIMKLLNERNIILQDIIYEHYPNLLDGIGMHKRFYKAIPDKFKGIDIDGDDYISLDELLKAIDNFFESKSDLTVDDLYELSEFFFLQ